AATCSISYAETCDAVDRAVADDATSLMAEAIWLVAAAIWSEASSSCPEASAMLAAFPFTSLTRERRLVTMVEIALPRTCAGARLRRVGERAAAGTGWEAAGISRR